MSEPAGHPPAAAGLPQGILQRAAHHFVHCRPPFPGYRRFQRLRNDAEPDGGVALVRGVDERIAPAAHCALPPGGGVRPLGGVRDDDGVLRNHPAGVPRDGHRLANVVPLGQSRRFEPDNQQGLPPVQPGEILGFGGIQHPQVGRPLLGLGNQTRAFGGARHPVKDHAGRGPVAGPRLYPQPRLGDDAQNALAADNQAVRRRPGPAARQPPRFPDARRRHHPRRFHKIVNVRVIGGVMPAAAGGDPAAQRGKLKALRKMPQREPVRTQLRLQRRPQRPGLDAGGAGYVVNLQRPVQPGQVNGDHGVGFRRLHPGHHAAAAPVGYRHNVGIGAPVQRGYDFRFGARVGDDIRRVRKIALETPDAVAETAPVGMRRPVVVVGDAKLRHQRVGQNARLAEVEVGVRGRRRRRPRGSIATVNALGHGGVIGRRRLAVGVPPGPETAARRHIIPPQLNRSRFYARHYSRIKAAANGLPAAPPIRLTPG